MEKNVPILLFVGLYEIAIVRGARVNLNSTPVPESSYPIAP